MKPHESLHRHDVKDIGFEEPTERVEVFFDPRKDILPGDIAMMRLAWEEVPEGRGSWHSASLAAEISALDPTFKVPASEMARLRTGLKKSRTRNEPWKYVQFIRALERIDPQFDPATYILPNDFDKIRTELLFIRHESDLLAYAEYTRILKDYDPKYDPAADVSAEELRQLRKYLQLTRDANDWDGYAEAAIELLDLDPDFDLATHLAPDIIAGFRQQLHSFREKDDGSNYAAYASHLLKLQQARNKIPSQKTDEGPLPPVRQF